MKRLWIIPLTLVLLFSSCTDKKDVGTQVVIETTMGDITIRLFDDTPRHKANFLKNVEQGIYDGMTWHRIVRGATIQTGNARMEGETLEPEILYPRYYHKRGMVGAARKADDENPDRRSASTEFYIVTGKTYDATSLAELHQMMLTEDTLHTVKPLTPSQKKAYTNTGGAPHLDGAYTIFGEVIKGLAVADKIASIPTDAKEHPLKAVIIKKVYVK